MKYKVNMLTPTWNSMSVFLSQITELLSWFIHPVVDKHSVSLCLISRMEVVSLCVCTTQMR